MNGKSKVDFTAVYIFGNKTVLSLDIKKKKKVATPF